MVIWLKGAPYSNGQDVDMPKRWITDQKEIESILNECQVASLATADKEATPYVVTVGYVYFDGKIYIHGALKGKKIENILQNPKVCLEMHQLIRIVQAPKSADFSIRYRSVIINGIAQLVKDTKRKKEILIRLTEKYAEGAPFEPPSDREVESTAVIEVTIESITGKKNVD